MAHTGSFPTADVVGIPGRTPWARGERHLTARTIALALAGVLAAGASIAAAGICYEAEGYGVLGVIGGGIIGVASAVPLWLLLRGPRPLAR